MLGFSLRSTVLPLHGLGTAGIKCNESSPHQKRHVFSATASVTCTTQNWSGGALARAGTSPYFSTIFELHDSSGAWACLVQLVEGLL